MFPNKRKVFNKRMGWNETGHSSVAEAVEVEDLNITEMPMPATKGQ
jgi:hypothetical protein